jgi:putative acetyltransferase
MRIRRARAEEIPAIARIAAESYRHAFKSILDARALQARGAVFFTRRLRRVRRRLSVAVMRGRVVGFALTTRGHLDMLFLAPRFIGRGVGLRLLRDVERRGVRTLECFRDNHAARRFYERAGWRLVRGYERIFIGMRHAFVFYERAP